MSKAMGFRVLACLTCGASLAHRAVTAKYCSRKCSPIRDPYFAGKTAKPKAEAISEKRLCLCCGNKFVSTWSGNRVCENCKTTALWRRQTF